MIAMDTINVNGWMILIITFFALMLLGMVTISLLVYLSGGF